MKKIEIRSADLNLVQEQVEQNLNQLIVEGYALVFEQPTILFVDNGVEYKEVIDRNALENADLTDVPFKYNHSKENFVLARTRNKTLELKVDEKGLFIRANLANITQGQDLYKLIQRGDIDKMSFGFKVAEESYDSITHTRRIVRIEKIVDVSAVSEPAYEATSISARDYFTAQEELIKLKEKEELRKKLIVMTY